MRIEMSRRAEGADRVEFRYRLWRCMYLIATKFEPLIIWASQNIIAPMICGEETMPANGDIETQFNDYFAADISTNERDTPNEADIEGYSFHAWKPAGRHYY